MEVDVEYLVVEVLEVDFVDEYEVEDDFSVEDVLSVEDDLSVEDVLNVEDDFEEVAAELIVEIVVGLKS